MAGNTVNMNLNVQDQNGSIKARTEDAKRLNAELEKAQKLATGTKTGARAYARSGPAGAIEDTEYMRGRGAMGATGAGARDFANQAQGLGGLVRLYATYAANVFAVGAAFSALREAMNTDIMIRGLDKLGAASGIAMGGLAKKFADASDGAISFRESMEASAKAISSGMSTKQFMELGVVAKGASQALGVSMSDAVSRLTRGITKLEPELLDELGIFTKVGKATEDYARNVGKSVDSLTDFEKRQAFANAVLKEGREKFGEIAGEANAYDKLLASLKNTSQQILSVVNEFIAPIAKLLAENTGLITAAIAIASIKILKQALPALTSWRNGLRDAAQDAAKRAEQINTSFGESFVERFGAKFKLPEIQKEIAATQKELQGLNREFEAGQAYKRPKQSSVLKSVQEDRLMNEREMATAQKEVAKYSQIENDAAKRHADILERKIAAQKRLVDLQAQESQIQDKIVDKATKKSFPLSGEWQREQIVQNERSRAASLNLLSQVGDLVSEKGFMQGMGQFYKDVYLNKDMGNFAKLKTAALGSFAGIATGAQILASSLSKAFMYLELAAAVLGIMNLLFGKNSKEVDAFNGSMSALADATKTATDVNEKYKNTLSIESINARANAFEGLADKIKESTVALSQADEAASWMDRMWDNIKVIWGGNLRNQFEEGLASSIIAAIKAMPEGEMRSNLEDKLKKTTGAINLSRTGLLQAFGKLSNEGIKQMGGEVSAITELSKRGLKDAQAITQDIKDTGKAVNDAYLTLKNSVADKTPVNLFLSTSIKQAENLKKSLDDITTAQVTFKGLVSKEIKPEFLTTETARAIMPLAEEAAKLSSEAKTYTDNLTTAKTRLEEIEVKLANVRKDRSGGSSYNMFMEEKRIVEDMISKSNEGLRSAEDRIRKLAEAAKKLMQDSIVSQINMSLEQTRLKVQQINNQMLQQAAAQLPLKTSESIRYQAELQKEAIAIEKMMFKAQETLVRSIDLLTLQVQRDADLREIANLQEERKQGMDDQISRQRLSMLQGRVRTADTAISAYNAQDLGTLSKLAAENPAVRGLLSSTQGIIAANAGFAAKINLVELNTKLAQINNRYDDQVTASENTLKALRNRLEAIVGNDEASMRAKNEIEAMMLREQQRQKVDIRAAREAEITGAVGDVIGKARVKTTTGKGVITDSATGAGAPTTGTVTGAQAVASVQAKSQDIRDTQNALESESAAAQNAARNLAAEVKAKEESISAAKALRDITEQGIKLVDEQSKQTRTFAREELSFKQQLGVISNQEFRDQKYALDLADATQDRDIKIREAIEQKKVAQDAYDLAILQNGGKSNEMLDAQKKLYESTYTSAVTGANNAYTAQTRLLELQNSLTDRQLAYSDIFKNTFQGMADAIVTFVQTGKLNFKDLINSMLADLLRYELRLQTMALWAAARPAVMSFIGSLFPGGGSLGAAAGVNMDAGITAPMGMNGGVVTAKGAFFDGNSANFATHKFARGGVFTNSIVDSPTLFKFAKGTGLMGEAGPEAIMPLKRGPDGTLGVRAGSGDGGNTQVIVNNYSNAHAETKETVDSRGNRQVEVIVGEMTAGEVSRSGSQAQRSIRNTFGINPQLIRR